MSLSRRTVIVGGASLGALLSSGCTGDKLPADDTGGTPTPTRDPEPDPWEAPGTEDADAFAWGVQVGDATPTSALVSVRTTAKALTLVLMAADGETWTEVSRTKATPDDRVAQVLLEGLTADTAYSLAAYADDDTRSPVARFRTALADDGYRVVVFGATSCFGGHSPWPCMQSAAAEKLDFFALLGDMIYADDYPDLYDYETKWDTCLSTDGMRAMTLSTSIAVTWDDHEVDNNWRRDTEGIDEVLAEAYPAFRRAMPYQDGGGEFKLWRKLSWGTVLDVFVLDGRGERVGDLYISVEQMEWLKAGLSSSTARFKIILNSVPITDLTAVFGSVMENDRWDGFTVQRSEILSYIADNAIPGILWISGDIHYGQLGTVDPEGGVAEGQWEAVVGPAGSTLNAIVTKLDPIDQFPIIFADYNWARFTCDPGRGTILVSFIDDDGQTIAEQELTL